MNPEYTTINNRRTRYAAARPANSPDLLLVNPSPVSIIA
jgi:hypothetical protein